MKSLTAVGAADAHDSSVLDDRVSASPFTRNEGIVHAALEKAGRPMKAYELLDILQDAGLRAPMTIYRALEGLQAKGRAQKVVSQNAFVSVDQRSGPNYRAVITCSRCGDARLVPLAEQDVRKILGATDMRFSEIVIEATGECDAICSHH
ncbi:MAG: hypothetical protein AAGC77_07135 [Pseudomonadota bacterium]